MKFRLSCLFLVFFSWQTCFGETPKIATAFTLPLWPAEDYYVLGPFLALDSGKYHIGEDRNATDGTDFGDSVYAVANGQVMVSQIIESANSWGKVVVIKHTLIDGKIIYSLYAHLETVSVVVGQVVNLGEEIGTIGDANGYYGPQNGSGPHLHFEIRTNNNWQPSSAAYFPTPINFDTLRRFKNPSLVIDDLSNIFSSSLPKNRWTIIIPPVNTSMTTTYLTYAGQDLTYAQAVSKKLVHKNIQYRWSGETSWRSSKPADVSWFDGVEYRVRANQAGIILNLVLPGHNFPAERAVQDMIWHASKNGHFTSCRPETIDEYDNDDDLFTFRQMDCVYKTSNGEMVTVTLHHATRQVQPLVRFITYENPDTGIVSAWGDNRLTPTQLDP